MAERDDVDVANLLALHARRHKQRAWYRLRDEVGDYIRRVAGLGPECRDIEYKIAEVSAAHVAEALRLANKTTTDITQLARATSR